jgi:hypothetical protein
VFVCRCCVDKNFFGVCGLQLTLESTKITMETPESTVDDSIDRILSCPSSLTKKYPSHLHESKKIREQGNVERPFASLTQIKSGGSLINPNMVQLFYW